MKIDDLKELEDRPVSVRDWLNRFSEKEQNILFLALTQKTPAQIYPIISQLDTNPFPFTRDTLAKYMRTLRFYDMEDK